MKRVLASVLCGLTLSACSTSKTAPCHDQNVVQATEGRTVPVHGWSDGYFDVELDDGHVYRIPETSDATADLKTGDLVQICALSATDGSEHYSLSLPGGIDGHTAQRVR
jgi:hypothetical protein